MTNQELIKKIKELNSIKPQAEFKEFSREVLLSQIRQIERAHSINNPVFNWRFYFRIYKDMVMQRATQPAFALLAILGLIMGSSVTVNAAFYSLPGQTLYPIKIGLEKTQLALVRDDVSRAELKMEFAKKRVEELDKIVAQIEKPEQKAKKINLVIKKFKQEVDSVKTQIQGMDLSKEEEGPMLRMAISIDSATSELAEALNENAANLPEEVKNALKEAVESAEATGISALETLVGVATSTIAEISESDLPDSLAKKIEVLKIKIAESAFLTEEDLAGINALVAEAELNLEESNYNLVLEKISAIKILIKEAEARALKALEAESQVPAESGQPTTTGAVLEVMADSPVQSSEIEVSGQTPTPAVSVPETTMEVIDD